jgi:hypothetical protein
MVLLECLFDVCEGRRFLGLFWDGKVLLFPVLLLANGESFIFRNGSVGV